MSKINGGLRPSSNSVYPTQLEGNRVLKRIYTRPEAWYCRLCIFNRVLIVNVSFNYWPDPKDLRYRSATGEKNIVFGMLKVLSVVR